MSGNFYFVQKGLKIKSCFTGFLNLRLKSKLDYETFIGRENRRKRYCIKSSHLSDNLSNLEIFEESQEFNDKAINVAIIFP